MESTSGNMETCGKVSMSGSLKMKLSVLENAINRIQEEIKHQKREIEVLTHEKVTLEQNLEQKAKEVKETIETEVNR